MFNSKALFKEMDMGQVHSNLKMYHGQCLWGDTKRHVSCYMFDSIYHVARFAEMYAEDLVNSAGWNPKSGGEEVFSNGPRWDQPIANSELMKLIEQGGHKNLVKSLDQFAFEIPDIESAMDMPESSVTGGSVLVPEYLSGEPLNMLGVQQDYDNRGPVKVFIGLLPGCEIDNKTLQARLAATLEMVKYLSNIRPVEYYAYISTDLLLGKPGASKAEPGGAVAAIKIPTNPINLAEACLIMHTSFARHMFASITGFVVPVSSGLPWPFRSTGNTQTTAATRAVLKATMDLGDDDIFIPEPPHTDPLTEDPQAWLTAMVRHYTGIEKMSGKMKEYYG